MISRQGVAIMCVLLTAGCGGRLNDIGVAPTMTAVGYGQGAHGGIDRQHLAVAQPPKAMMRPDYADGSLWHSGPSSLFGDRRAASLGDILTVVIEIKDEASISNSTNRARTGSEAMAVPNFLGLPQVIGGRLPGGAGLDPAVGASSSSSSTGAGSVSRNEEITLRIAATVVDVLPNGHLVVRGNQEVRVNFELRDLQIAGIVRPEDISRRNEITYDKIAGARISYGGRGQISDVQQPRYGQQIADIILPF